MDILIPALSLRRANGEFDEPAMTTYIRRASDTWIDRFILAGSTDSGYSLTNGQRETLLDFWISAVPASRLIACCWSHSDTEAALQRGIDVLATVASHHTRHLTDLPPSVFAYSHPHHSPIVVTAPAVTEAREQHTLVRGTKVSKISTEGLSAIRAAAGEDFILWHGSSRDLGRSWQFGATGVVCASLAVIPTPFPPRRPVTCLQRHVDELNSKAARVGELNKYSFLRSLAFAT